VFTHGWKTEGEDNSMSSMRSIFASSVLGGFLLLFLVGSTTAAQAAEAYPSKPIRMMVGFAVGGANDLVARAIAIRLSTRLGRAIVVENRPGAGGDMAAEVVARAAPDGYTLLLGSVSSLAMGPALYKSVPYDPVNDFAPVTQAVSVPSMLSAHPSMSVRSVKEFVARAQRDPGKINVACPGIGSVSHLAGELFKRMAKIDVVLVPYKGGAPALNEVLGGQVEAMMSLMSTQVPHVQSGKLIGLAVTSSKRTSALPSVPTIAESGYPGYVTDGWLGILFPAGTPREIVTRMHREIKDVMGLPEVRSQLEILGMSIELSDNPDSFQALIRDELAKWKKLVKEANIQIK
jgi:tripartite-type tricarboxylate transporter receptor subunit TctC